jgi:hypothetical protein
MAGPEHDHGIIQADTNALAPRKIRLAPRAEASDGSKKGAPTFGSDALGSLGAFRGLRTFRELKDLQGNGPREVEREIQPSPPAPEILQPDMRFRRTGADDGILARPGAGTLGGSGEEEVVRGHVQDTAQGLNVAHATRKGLALRILPHADAAEAGVGREMLPRSPGGLFIGQAQAVDRGLKSSREQGPVVARYALVAGAHDRAPHDSTAMNVLPGGRARIGR